MSGDCRCQFPVVFPARLVPQRPNCSLASCSGDLESGQKELFPWQSPNGQTACASWLGGCHLHSSHPLLCSGSQRAQFLRAAEVSLTADNLSAPAGVTFPLEPQVLLPSGSQPGSDNITSSVRPSSLVGKVAGLWVPFCLLAASQPSPPCSQIHLGHSWTHSGFTHPGWTLINTGSLSPQGQVCPAPHWAAEWDLVLEPMWSVRQTQSLVPDRTRFKSECRHEGSVSSLSVLVCDRRR